MVLVVVVLVVSVVMLPHQVVTVAQHLRTVTQAHLFRTQAVVAAELSAVRLVQVARTLVMELQICQYRQPQQRIEAAVAVVLVAMV
jgi:hypothetical protein